ncbi:MAG: PhzF family phenazine biosynthesis protein [Sulfitobacter sp.]
MERRFIQCDVFSDVALRGNGLAVVLDGTGLTQSQMQRFARWTQQAETTYLFPPTVDGADYAVRIFSPTREMPFAGHPTLGSCAAWLHAGGRPVDPDHVVQECAIGLVEVDRTGSVPAFVAPPTTESSIDSQEQQRICAALGIAQDEVLAAVRLDNGVVRHVLELRDAARVLSLDSAAVSLPAFSGVSVIGRYPQGSEAAYETRNLTPASMASEDPITGSMNAAIAVWLKGQGRLSKDIVISQGTVLGCKGRVFVRSRGAEVLIGGQTTVVIDGQVTL